MAWVTPLGTGLDEVWGRIANGERGEVRELSIPDSDRKHSFMPVPPKLVDAVGRNPRLRRSSAISYFTAAAGLAALENAGIEMTPEVAERTAVVFAISSGSVVYTRKFYETIVKQGANVASPLLFPETVYNAPTSHLAALMGITGMSYTLVGDASVGIEALKFSTQLLDTADIDQCLVVGGEEVDWVLCEGYRTWRFPVVLAEGAAALVVSREGKIDLRQVHDGVPFFKRAEAASAISKVHAGLAGNGPVDLVVSCANGSFIDGAEAVAVAESFPNAQVACPKRALGEAIGASALLQTIYAALALEKLPVDSALVSCLGMNYQAAGLVLAPG